MSTSTDLNVLVSGGGIAGNAVALQLLRAGARVTVIERAAEPRPGGQAVDLRGPSKEVAELMGLRAAIAARQLHEEGMSYVDGAGREFASMTMADYDGKAMVAEIEISRGDLNDVLLKAIDAAGGVDYRYGEWIEGVDQDLADPAAGVTVTFASGAQEQYHLVVGADGVHSATRRLVFGPEEQFATFLDGYMAFFTIPTPADAKPDWIAMHAVPSAAVAIRPDYDPNTSKAIITLRAPADPALRRNVSAQKQLIRDLLGDAGWHAPTVLAAMADTPDFYFDELARITVPTLSRGRVTLLGDAGYCGSPMTGQGTAMALVGAYILAGELAATPGDVPGALARYEDKITPFLDKAREMPGGGIKMMLPTSNVGRWWGNQIMKLMATRLMRPVMKKMLSNTDDYTLPAYPSVPA